MNITITALILCLCTSSLICADQVALDPEIIRGVDKIVIRSGGTCHRDKKAEREILCEVNRDKVHGIMEGIKLGERCAGSFDSEDGRHTFIGNCGCCGEYTIEGYSDTVLKFEISIHHWSHYRSKIINDGLDTRITEGSIAFLKGLIGAK